MSERESRINARLAAHYNRAIQHYGAENVLGVFLYGSQNYGCDLETSDVDTKCILLPDLYHLAIKPYETKHLHIPRDVEGEYEVCECMTLMHMCANWKKQNPNFLEILFTEFFIVNPAYSTRWHDFRFEWREKIAHYDIRQGILSVAHQAIHTIKQNPMDGKKIGNGYRLLHLLCAYDFGVDYAHCLVPLEDDCEKIKRLKSGEEKVQEEWAETLIQYFDSMIKVYEEKEMIKDKSVELALENFILLMLQDRLDFDYM